MPLIFSRLRGLLFRPELKEGRAVTFPCRQVHTFLMAFSIDVLFLDKKSHCGTAAGNGAGRVSPLVREAYQVLELRPGWCKRKTAERGTIIHYKNGNRKYKVLNDGNTTNNNY